MIIVDFSGIAVAGAAVAFKLEGKSGNDELDKDNIRHIILNSIREISKQNKRKYGEMVIAFDNDIYWRREIFPAYKAARKDRKKENDSVPWELMYEVMKELDIDLQETFGYNVINVRGAEADDVIGVMVKEKSEGMSPEPIMIISNDGDMKQLQKYPNVKQYSTMQSKYVIEKDPAFWLKEKCIRGDRKDGIPNIFSKVSHFVKTPEIRQKSVTKVFLADIMNKPVEKKLSEQELGRYKQNEILMSFEKIPNKVSKLILDKYNTNDTFNNQSEIYNYLTKHGMLMLVDCISDF